MSLFQDGESGREPTLNEVLRRIRHSKKTGIFIDRRAEGFTVSIDCTLIITSQGMLL